MILDHESYSDSIDAICGLFERSFGRSLSPGFLRWRYLDNPFGEILANVEPREEGGVAANYSASPVQMRIHGEDVCAALSMTTMTDPAYAGRGLFTTLAAELYEEMHARSIAMVWGFPNRNSHHAFVHRLQWRDVYEIPTMVLEIRDQPAEDSTNIQTDNHFQLEYEQNRDPAEIYVLKSRDYLRWRYSSHPFVDYSNIILGDARIVSSFCVVKRYQDTLDVVDFEARDHVEGAELLRQVLAFGQREGLAAVNCWAPRHHFLHGLCERAGFENGAPVTYLGFRELAGLRSGAPVSADYECWFVQMGDSDVY